jgi:hypothetical protein
MDSTDSLSDPANRLSLAAVALAVGAFLVAALQALLQYASASEARNKCNDSAIYVAANGVKRRWSYTAWKWKYFYPQINFHSGKFLLALLTDDSLEMSPAGELLQGRPTGSLVGNFAARAIKPDEVMKPSHLGYVQPAEQRRMIKMQASLTTEQRWH